MDLLLVEDVIEDHLTPGEILEEIVALSELDTDAGVVTTEAPRVLEMIDGLEHIAVCVPKHTDEELGEYVGATVRLWRLR